LGTFARIIVRPVLVLLLLWHWRAIAILHELHSE
jgi:hypothetical protein